MTSALHIGEGEHSVDILHRDECKRTLTFAWGIRRGLPGSLCRSIAIRARIQGGLNGLTKFNLYQAVVPS